MRELWILKKYFLQIDKLTGEIKNKNKKPRRKK